jgi:hypothetical protein
MTNANTWYDALSFSLAAGKYLITGTLTMGRAATTATSYCGRLSDGASAHYVSSQFSQASLNPHVVTITLAAIIVLGSTTTVKLQGIANVAASIIYAATTINGTGNNASSLKTLKLA